MAHSLSSTLQLLRSTSIENGLALHQILVRRWYGLPKRVTGELSWIKNHEARKKKRGDKPVPSYDELIERPMANLKRCRYARATKLNKAYDICMTPEELAKAEKLLVAYRHSLSFPRASLPMAVVRACIRVGRPERAIHYARNKVQFGVFPTRRLYNVLMDACLDKGNAKGAMSAYDLLLSDEWTPDGMTYYMATRAALQLELDRVAKETANQIAASEAAKSKTENAEVNDKSEVETGNNENEEPVNKESELEAAKSESEEVTKEGTNTARVDLTKTLEFCEQCSQLEPKLGTKTKRVLVTTLLSEGFSDEASGLLQSWESENKLPQQTLLNLKLDVCTSTSDFEGAFALLKSIRNQAELGMPKEGLPRLRQAITDMNNSELASELETICAEIESRNVQ